MASDQTPKRNALSQNLNNIPNDDWSKLSPFLKAVGFDAVKQWTIDYIQKCDENIINKIHSLVTPIDIILPQDILAYSFQFLLLTKRIQLSILSKSFAKLMQTNGIWKDARIHVFPSNKNDKNNFKRKIQVTYDSSESPCVMVPSSLFGLDNYTFLNVIEYLCVNVHEWNYIHDTIWNKLQKYMKYLYITHNDRFTPSFDFINQRCKSIKYLRIDFSPTYLGVISLELPQELIALSFSCLNTSSLSWRYLAQIKGDQYDDMDIDNDNDLIFNQYGNTNTETLLSVNIFIQQKFHNLIYLKLTDCYFNNQYELQSILDSCKKLKYLSLIRTKWTPQVTMNDIANNNKYVDKQTVITNVALPSSLSGLCLIGSSSNIDFSKCSNSLWEIAVNVKLFNKLNHGLLNRLSNQCNILKQIVLFGDISTDILKIITNAFNTKYNKIRIVISPKASVMIKYWTKKFGVVCTRIINPYIVDNKHNLFKDIKSKTSMFHGVTTDIIQWQYS